MGWRYDQLDTALTLWITQQPMFFVATAPGVLDGHVTLSPKGDARTFRVLGPQQFAYLDVIGAAVTRSDDSTDIWGTCAIPASSTSNVC